MTKKTKTPDLSSCKHPEAPIWVLTEEYLEELIHKIVSTLPHTFAFGPHTMEDIRQEAVDIIMYEGLPSWNPKLPLENFIRVHTRNRLLNFIRNKQKRSETPCASCQFYQRKTKTCGLFESKDECDKFKQYTKRNADKQSILTPAELDETRLHVIQPLPSDNSLHNFLLAHIPSDLRSDFIKIAEGVAITRKRQKMVAEACAPLVEEWRAMHGETE